MKRESQNGLPRNWFSYKVTKPSLLGLVAAYFYGTLHKIPKEFMINL